LLRGSRVVVPPQGPKAVVIDLLHDGHPGSIQMKVLARSFVWWSGIDHNLEVKACDARQRTRHCFAQVPLHPWEFPSVPWERLHADLRDLSCLFNVA